MKSVNEITEDLLNDRGFMKYLHNKLRIKFHWVYNEYKENIPLWIFLSVREYNKDKKANIKTHVVLRLTYFFYNHIRKDSSKKLNIIDYDITLMKGYEFHDTDIVLNDIIERYVKSIPKRLNANIYVRHILYELFCSRNDKISVSDVADKYKMSRQNIYIIKNRFLKHIYKIYTK